MCPVQTPPAPEITEAACAPRGTAPTLEGLSHCHFSAKLLTSPPADQGKKAFWGTPPRSRGLSCSWAPGAHEAITAVLGNWHHRETRGVVLEFLLLLNLHFSQWKEGKGHCLGPRHSPRGVDSIFRPVLRANLAAGKLTRPPTPARKSKRTHRADASTWGPF